MKNQERNRYGWEERVNMLVNMELGKEEVSQDNHKPNQISQKKILNNTVLKEAHNSKSEVDNINYTVENL